MPNHAQTRKSTAVTRCVAILLLTGVSPLRAGQQVRNLPDEGTLPETVTALVALPSESSLPEVEAAPGGVIPPEQLPDPRQWPDEAALPGPPPEPPPAQEKDPKQLPPIGQRPAERPWLRMNMRGHTGTIRSLAFTRDSQFLGSGGEDKSLEVWTRMPAAVDPQRPWLHERTIRWQVHRADRGRIYAVAAGNPYLAIAGHGAEGSMGEILLLDPATGALNAALYNDEMGHRQVVASLCFSPNEAADQLASQDVDGKSLLWKRDADTGLWKPSLVFASDPELYPPDVVQALQPWRRFVPLAMAGPDRLIVARPAEQPAAGATPKWKLVSVDTRTNRPSDIQGSDVHYGMVLAMAANRQGTRLVTSDAYLDGHLHFWDLTTNAHRLQTNVGGPVISLDVSPNGRYVLVGTKRQQAPASIQLWDVRNVNQPRKVLERRVQEDVYACAISPDGVHYVYSQAGKLQVGRFQDFANGPVQPLGPNVRPPLRVAFALEKPYYRIAIGYQEAGQGRVDFEEVFDTGTVQLSRRNRINQKAWMPADWTKNVGRWDFKEDRKGEVISYWLMQNDKPVARIPLDPARHGAPTAFCWIPDANTRPYALAVGTDGRNNIYVYRLVSQGICPLIRQFRGHWSAVTSLGVSRDRRYLVSASLDSTIRVWKLEGFDQVEPFMNQWGAELKVVNNRLVAESVREDGPLFGRGLRAGDVITQLKWGLGDQDQESNDPAKMLDALEKLPFDTLFSFFYQRPNEAAAPFSLFAAWPPVVSLFVTDDGEWAYWTPAGFYDASFNGHKLFGWQINHGRRLLPEFFLAAQLRQALERPDVMGKLLEAGSLEQAFLAAQRDPPVDSPQAVVSQFRLKPRVEILEPTGLEKVEGDVVPVRAAVTIRDGLQLAPPKVFANGVVAGKGRLLSEEQVAGGRRLVYQWEARLPRDPRVLLQVVAATDARAVEMKTTTLLRAGPTPPRRGRMFVFAAGINDYQDAQIPRLDFAVNNASSLVSLLRSRSQTFYESHVASLLDGHATKSMWKVVTEQYADQLREEVSADDLLVIYLSGHGVRDEETMKYYYVTANARYADIKAQRYADCMSLEDFAVFADIPCRKLVILDTCHSGAVQPLQQKNLKAAMRALQDDMIITITASDGNQEAVEEKQRKLGRFTYELLEALQGGADTRGGGGNEDRVVTLSEVIQFVKRAVEEDSAADTFRQTPTAGPLELLPYVDLPLTSGEFRSR